MKRRNERTIETSKKRRVAPLNPNLHATKGRIQTNESNAANNYALQVAAAEGNLEEVERLLSCEGTDPTANDNCAIREAVANRHPKVVDRLLKCEGVATLSAEALKQLLDPNGSGYNYVLQRAATNGLLEFVNLLLTKKVADPTADNNYAIRMAAEHGHLEVVDRLLKCKGVDIAAKDNYAIQMAAANRHREVVDYLLGLYPPAVKNILLADKIVAACVANMPSPNYNRVNQLPPQDNTNMFLNRNSPPGSRQKEEGSEQTDLGEPKKPTLG